MKPVTATDLMCKSVCFRLLLGFGIAMTLVAMILGVVSTNVTCKSSGSSYCSSYFYYSSTECSQNGTDYCCGTYYDSNLPYYSCRNNGLYCYIKPVQTNLPCTALIIVARSFMGFSFLLFIILLAMACHFRGVKRRLDKNTYEQALLFSNQEEFQRYQHAQYPQNMQTYQNPAPQSGNNLYSLNAPYAGNYNQGQKIVHVQEKWCWQWLWKTLSFWRWW